MLLLAIDTATDAVVVGVVRADPATSTAEVLAERTRPGARQHGERLMPAVLEACAEAGVRPAALDGVVCGVGPGPFTGLRVGIASAAAVADAVGIPTYGVCSLDAVAAATTGSLLVVTDARRREVYWAAYQDGRRTAGPEVGPPAALAECVPGLGVTAVAGTLAEQHAELLGLPVHPARAPTPAGLVAAAALGGQATSAPEAATRGLGRDAVGRDAWAPLEPLYLRRPDAVPPAARKRVTG